MELTADVRYAYIRPTFVSGLRVTAPDPTPWQHHFGSQMIHVNGS
jgi:hypothetical protein